MHEDRTPEPTNTTCPVCGIVVAPAMPAIVLHASRHPRSAAVRVCGDECARVAQGKPDLYLDDTLTGAPAGDR